MPNFITRCVLLLSCVCISTHADEVPGPWPRHTIDNTSRGADGVRLGDINGDGLMDIATGWEEGGAVRVYLNPGPEKSTEKWPAVTVGRVNDVEDAVMIDLDNDGTFDVVSSCEGKTKTMYVHWGPKDKTNLLDEDAWTTQPIPATGGLQQWMMCTPMDVDGKHGIDLIVGSKGRGAAVGWLESPKDPRDLSAWQYHKVRDAGWIMSLEVNEYENMSTLLVTDRKGPTRSVYRLHHWRGEWHEILFESDESQYMFGCTAHQWRTACVVATRDGAIKILIWVNYRDEPRIEKQIVPIPFGVKAGKAVALGDIDRDESLDIVVSSNTQPQKEKPGVAWIKMKPDKDPKDWPAYDISGPEGKKFDRIELIDLDGDGDLDVLTCEEVDNLGVVWYENPYGKPEPGNIP